MNFCCCYGGSVNWSFCSQILKNFNTFINGEETQGGAEHLSRTPARIVLGDLLRGRATISQELIGIGIWEKIC